MVNVGVMEKNMESAIHHSCQKLFRQFSRSGFPRAVVEKLHHAFVNAPDGEITVLRAYQAILPWSSLCVGHCLRLRQPPCRNQILPNIEDLVLLRVLKQPGDCIVGSPKQPG